MRAALLVFAAATAAVFVACSAILGVEEVSYLVADGGRPFDADPTLDGGQPLPCPNGTWCDCQPSHALCLDFDRPLGLVAPPGRSYDFYLSGIADAGVDDARSVSHPNSLRAVGQTSADGGGASAEISSSFLGSSRTMRVDFEVFFDRAAHGSSNFMVLSFEGPSCQATRCFLLLSLDFTVHALVLAEYFEFDGGTESIPHPLQAALASGADWVHVTVTSTTTAGKSVLGAVVGGVPALDASAGDRFGGAPNTLYLGLDNLVGSPGEPWVIHFDNVTLDVGP